MCVEEGTYIANHKGELLNSKSEWHQPKLIRTTTRVVQGGAESIRQQGGHGVGGVRGGRGGGHGVGGGRFGGGGQVVRDHPRGQGRTRGQ